MADSLEEIVKHSIQLPENPFWKEGKSFGLAEVYAHVAGTLATFAVDSVSDNNVYITLAAPVLDKFIFLIKSGIDEIHKYRGTPEEERLPTGKYFKEGLKNAAILCGKDALVQDTIYAGIMLTLLKLYPDAPAWPFSMVGLAGGVALVSAGQVGYNEASYGLKQLSLRRAGFKEDSCLEARFYMPSKEDALDVFGYLREQHRLGEVRTAAFTDNVIGSRVAFNERIVKSRLRYCTNPEVPGENYSADVTFSKSTKRNSQPVQQFNYFFQKKKKMAMSIPERADTLDEISDERIKRALRGAARPNGGNRVSYLREYSYNTGLRVSLDYVVPSLDMDIEEARTSESSHCVLELECPNERIYLAHLEKVMRDVMSRSRSLETTYDKEELVNRFFHR